jgi:hypothetical protein
MSFDNYPLRILLSIAVIIVTCIVIVGIIASAPNFIVGMVILIPIVPLLRIVGDIVNPNVALPLNPRTLLRHYLAVLFLLVLMLGAIVLVLPVAVVSFAILGAALVILLAGVGLLLWGLQHGLGITLARPLPFAEWLPLLLLLGAGIGGGAIALGVAYLGLAIKNYVEAPFWRFVDRLRAQIDALNE